MSKTKIYPPFLGRAWGGLNKNRPSHIPLPYLLISIFIFTAIIYSCKKDKDLIVNPPDTNEEEVITTMTITFIDSAGVNPTVQATFKDPDGDGGNGPTIFDTIKLDNNTIYNASIILLNETKNPADTISNEVLEEANEHLFCFSVSDADVTITRTDSDGNYEVGLKSKWVTGSSSSGYVTVTLKHQLEIKDGTCNPGETDVEVNFVIEIQ